MSGGHSGAAGDVFIDMEGFSVVLKGCNDVDGSEELWGPNGMGWRWFRGWCTCPNSIFWASFIVQYSDLAERVSFHERGYCGASIGVETMSVGLDPSCSVPSVDELVPQTTLASSLSSRSKRARQIRVRL